MEGIASLLLIALFCAIFGIFCLLAYYVFFCISNFNLWLEGKAAGLGVSFFDLLRMKFRKLSSRQMIDHLKILRKAGVMVECEQLESHVLAGGKLSAVTQAAVAANKAGLKLSFNQMASIDLAGRDVLDAVESNVVPKVLVCPQPERGNNEASGLTGVAKDGVRLAVMARVTVRTRLDKIVGGAGEATIIARVGEGIVSAIGRAESHREILERPEIITKAILSKGLDVGTCYEIVSMDISDIEVQENVAARLMTEQADADKRVAQALAARRKANAVAAQREMASLTLEKQAKVECAKANLPVSLASAFKEDNLGSLKPFPPLVDDLRWKGL